MGAGKMNRASTAARFGEIGGIEKIRDFGGTAFFSRERDSAAIGAAKARNFCAKKRPSAFPGAGRLLKRRFFVIIKTDVRLVTSDETIFVMF